MSWKASHYTHLIDLKGGGGVVYNGFTGAVVKLSPGAFGRVGEIVRGAPGGLPLPAEFEADPLFEHLAAGGFVVDAGFDELAAIEGQYQRERQHSQFLLTILPTFGCNLGCDYCFVGKKSGKMSRERQEQVIAFFEGRFSSRQFPSMSVDWFGGEPLLALDVIEHLSAAFRRLCERHGADYSAQVITNGTVISER